MRASSTVLWLALLVGAAHAQINASTGIKSQGVIATDDCVKFVSRTLVTSYGAPCGTATSIPYTGISGLGSGVANFLGTPSWANFNTALTTRPYFRANNSGAAQTNIPDSSFTKINFGTEVVDNGSYYDPSTSTWTPPANCLAFITSAVLVQGTYSNGDIYLAIYKNGSAFKGVNTKTSVATSMQVTGLDVANGTDAYTVYAYTDTSSGTGTANQSAVYSTFAGACL